jgi:hypothetical protein
LNAAPLGLEIGHANLVGAKAKLGDALQNAGTNEYTHGPMFRTGGAVTGIKDLQSVLLIFDPNDRLQGLIMTFPKDPKTMFKLLSGKYSVVSNKVNNFMNNGSARFEEGESWVDLDAPHLGFEMKVSYVSKALQQQFEKQTAEQEQRERAHKVDQL